MAIIRKEAAYTFDDVLLIPKYSEILPTSTSTKTFLTKDLCLDVPILSSAMDTVTEWKLAVEMSKIGGLGVLHKNMSIENQVRMVLKVKNFEMENEVENKSENVNSKLMDVFSDCAPSKDSKNRYRVAAAVGVTDSEKKRVEELLKANVDLIVVDTAHGHSFGVIEMVKWIRKNYLNTNIAAGNVASKEATLALIEAGADIVKVGIGPGSICTTRVVSGVGVPQLQAVIECSEVAKKYSKTIIADGGIRYSGDLVKAIAAGAHSVMMGSVLAGVEESPGEIVEVDGKKYKTYRGMGSLGAMISGSKDRYGQSEISRTEKLVPEGVEGLVPCSGNLYEVLYKMWGGLRSGLGYLGAKNLEELQANAEFVPITNAGKIESYPHSLLNHKDIFKK